MASECILCFKNELKILISSQIHDNEIQTHLSCQVENILQDKICVNLSYAKTNSITEHCICSITEDVSKLACRFSTPGEAQVTGSENKVQVCSLFILANMLKMILEIFHVPWQNEDRTQLCEPYKINMCCTSKFPQTTTDEPPAHFVTKLSYISINLMIFSYSSSLSNDQGEKSMSKC